jgi:hypothetical protein
LEQLDRIPFRAFPSCTSVTRRCRRVIRQKSCSHAGRAERLPLGEGAIDIRGILKHMPKGIPVALEVQMTATATAEGAEAVALRVRQAADRLLTA